MDGILCGSGSSRKVRRRTEIESHRKNWSRAFFTRTISTSTVITGNQPLLCVSCPPLSLPLVQATRNDSGPAATSSRPASQLTRREALTGDAVASGHMTPSFGGKISTAGSALSRGCIVAVDVTGGTEGTGKEMPGGRGVVFGCAGKVIV